MDHKRNRAGSGAELEDVKTQRSDRRSVRRSRRREARQQLRDWATDSDPDLDSLDGLDLRTREKI